MLDTERAMPDGGRAMPDAGRAMPLGWMLAGWVAGAALQLQQAALWPAVSYAGLMLTAVAAGLAKTSYNRGLCSAFRSRGR